MSGIHTVDDLRQRCVVDEDTSHWHWRGATNAGRYISLWLPALRRSVSIGVAICWLTTGQHANRGHVWHRTCGEIDCANPAHFRRGTRASQMRALKYKPDPLAIAKATQRRREVGKLSESDVQRIRTADLTIAEIVAEFGVCRSYACDVRNGKRRAPLAAPGSSVFSWREG